MQAARDVIQTACSEPCVKGYGARKGSCKAGYAYFLYAEFQVDFTLVSTEIEPRPGCLTMSTVTLAKIPGLASIGLA